MFHHIFEGFLCTSPPQKIGEKASCSPLPLGLSWPQTLPVSRSAGGNQQRRSPRSPCDQPKKTPGIEVERMASHDTKKPRRWAGREEVVLEVEATKVREQRSKENLDSYHSWNNLESFQFFG